MKSIIKSLCILGILGLFSTCKKDPVPSGIEAISLIKINEFVGRGSQLLNEFGEKADWIELYNSSDEAITLTANRWHLSDKLDQLDQFNYDKDLTIPAKGYLLIWADGYNFVSDDAIHTNFKLSNEGEHIVLSYTNDLDKVQLIDFYAYELLLEDNKSYGRLPDGTDNWTSLVAPTPNSANQ